MKRAWPAQPGVTPTEPSTPLLADPSIKRRLPRALTSWKEIAQHLGVNVRTAQRWERERGLPVVRTGGARSRVSADVAAIERWKERRSHVHQEQDSFSWPLGPGLKVEIRFIGREIEPGDVDLFREYLRLLKTALSRN